jgi:hypothetical protein
MPWLAIASAITACSQSSPSSVGPSTPVIVNHGGPTMSHVRLVTVTFGVDPDRAALEGYGAWIASSSWLRTVGHDYGVTGGESLGGVALPDLTTATVDDATLRGLLLDGIASGSVPRPADGDFGSVLYALHVQGHSVTDGSSVSCTDFIGYHASARRIGLAEVAYAVIVECATPMDFVGRPVDWREQTLAHELIEAATDPFPARGYHMRDPNDPWNFGGGEVADLCDLVVPGGAVEVESGRWAVRVWSNSIAATGMGDPCIPSVGGQSYGLHIAPWRRQRVRPGDHVTFGASAWTAPTLDRIGVAIVVNGTANGTPELAPGWLTLVSGQVFPFVVDVPATAAPSSSVIAHVYMSDGHTARGIPLVATVDPPCATATTCDTCAMHGCGWCAATGRCEEAGEHGSAQSTCSGPDWARWVGACPGHCAAAATTCATCAAIAGCGWCATGGCMPASDDGATSADGACSGDAWSFVPSYCP